MDQIVRKRLFLAIIASPMVLPVAGVVFTMAAFPSPGIAQNPGNAATQPKSSPRGEYRRRFKALDPKDVQGHYALAEWCHEQKEYQLLLRQTQHVLRLEPAHENAKILRRIAIEELKREPGAADDDKAGKEGEEEEADGEFLTPQQVQQLRYAELLDPPDNTFNPAPNAEETEDRPLPLGPPEFAKIVFDRKVLTDFLDQMSGHRDFSSRDRRDEFLRLPPTKQFQLIRFYTGNQYAKRIDIRSDPLVFRQFKKVLPLVMSKCGTASCHGGKEAEGFRLRVGRPGSEANLYTNFLILNRATKGKDRLINRDKPEASLILEYGLPERYAKRKHPDDIIVDPLYPQGPKDPRYQTVLKWIESLRMPVPRSDVSLPGYPEPPPPGSSIGGEPAKEGKTATPK